VNFLYFSSSFSYLEFKTCKLNNIERKVKVKKRVRERERGRERVSRRRGYRVNKNDKKR
jgi:hypothetical protein